MENSKELLKEYEKWCEKERRNPFNQENMEMFLKIKKEEKEKAEKVLNSKVEERKKLVKKQKEIFNLMSDYVGLKVKYDDVGEWFFETFDTSIKSIVGATAVIEADNSEDLDEVCKKIFG